MDNRQNIEQLQHYLNELFAAGSGVIGQLTWWSGIGVIFALRFLFSGLFSQDGTTEDGSTIVVLQPFSGILLLLTNLAVLGSCYCANWELSLFTTVQQWANRNREYIALQSKRVAVNGMVNLFACAVYCVMVIVNLKAMFSGIVCLAISLWMCPNIIRNYELAWIAAMISPGAAVITSALVMAINCGFASYTIFQVVHFMYQSNTMPAGESTNKRQIFMENPPAYEEISQMFAQFAQPFPQQN
ncbi:uncharacterized protein LOC129585184 [Paramacrobiotus metropolitanus]|uniref:uncharacterized protein LOC129585184 n=1 Tax=Paramacrobiotus metropolitanus TaxID=2943436 RepID=UPI002446226E|nr:uncharacterized protein LOC129585184 [Paramacrobiotus metropolitanus]